MAAPADDVGLALKLQPPFELGPIQGATGLPGAEQQTGVGLVIGHAQQGRGLQPFLPARGDQLDGNA